MEKSYHTIHKNDTLALVNFLTTNGQMLLPMVELIERSRRSPPTEFRALSGGGGGLV